MRARFLRHHRGLWDSTVKRPSLLWCGGVHWRSPISVRAHLVRTFPHRPGCPPGTNTAHHAHELRLQRVSRGHHRTSSPEAISTTQPSHQQRTRGAGSYEMRDAGTSMPCVPVVARDRRRAFRMPSAVRVKQLPLSIARMSSSQIGFGLLEIGLAFPCARWCVLRFRLTRRASNFHDV